MNSTISIYDITVISYIIIIILGIILGAGENRKVVIFEDYNDLGLTFLIPVSFILITYLLAMLHVNQILSMVVGGLIAAFLLIKLVINTYRINGENIGKTLLSLLTKTPLAIIWMLNFIEILNPGGKGYERSKNRGQAMVVLALLTPILSLLIVNKSGSLFNPQSWIKGRRVGNAIRNNL